MTLEQLVSAINEELRSQLERSRCINGHLHYQASVALIHINGFSAAGNSYTIWQSAPELQSLLAQYVKEAPDCGGVMITIDLVKDQFNYHELSVIPLQQLAQQQVDQQREKIQVIENKRRDQEKRKALEQKTRKIGVTMAENVADALLHDHVGYSHRDYCGMGLEHRDGIYKYGELHDGYLIEPVLQWETKEAFVIWLAEQSDASLARLEEQDPWYWGNQTINRVRLVSLINRARKR
jgi:hypothetical protein